MPSSARAAGRLIEPALPAIRSTPGTCSPGPNAASGPSGSTGSSRPSRPTSPPGRQTSSCSPLPGSSRRGRAAAVTHPGGCAHRRPVRAGSPASQLGWSSAVALSCRHNGPPASC